MIESHTMRALGRALLLACALVWGVAPVSGCMSSKPTIEDGQELQGALRNFHKNLRWARYEFASELVADAYRPTFMGRYEELGEDFHIVMLEVKKVVMVPGERRSSHDVNPPSARARVEVEQQWYREPSMTVRKDKYVELWRRQRDGWRLTERLLREEWREREKARKQDEVAAR